MIGNKPDIKSFYTRSQANELSLHLKTEVELLTDSESSPTSSLPLRTKNTLGPALYTIFVPGQLISDGVKLEL